MKEWPKPSYMSPEVYKTIDEIIRKAKEYDKLTGQPDCPADDKLKWIGEFNSVTTMPPINLTSMGKAFPHTDSWPYPPSAQVENSYKY